MSRAGFAVAGCITGLTFIAVGGCQAPGAALPEMPQIQRHVSLTTTSGPTACEDAEQPIEDEAVLFMRVSLENERHRRLYPPDPGSFDAGTSGGGGGGGGPGTVSTTNLQTAGVDEADVMKNDGTRLFTLSGDTLVALQTWPDTQLQVKGRVAVAQGASEMLLTSPDRLVVFSNRLLDTEVTYVDVSDLSNPRVTGSVQLRGAYLTARRVGTAIRLIVRDRLFMPAGVDLNPPLAPEDAGAWTALAASYESLIRAQPLSHWLAPATTRDAAGQERSWPHACDQVSSSNAPVALGLMAVATLDASAPSRVDRWSMLGEAEIVYASQTALYLASSHWWWWEWLRNGEGATYVHQFDISTAATAVHVASGVFDGQLPDSFALDEWGGHLRVATQAPVPGGIWPSSQTVRVLVLEPRDKELVEVGRSPNLTPGEPLQSARFLGPRAFVVTYRMADPLFTLDMTDPTAPRLVAALSVPGFSTYLHPVSDTQLIGVGTSPSWGVQVSLFDVSDLAHPTLTASRSYDTAFSLAQRDHRAFTWLPERKLFAIPLERNVKWGSAHQSDLRVFQVTGADLVEQGAVPLPDFDGPAGYVRRGILTTEDAYAVAADRVTAARLTDLSTPVATALLAP